MLSRRTLLSALALSAAAWGLSAHAAGQTLVPAQSEVTFVAKQLGVPLQGRFKRFQAQVAFDPKALPTSKIAFELDLGSVALNADADAELPKAEWFNVPKSPKATFQSTAIQALGGGKFQVRGKLAIKGQARDLVVPVTLTQAKGLSTASGAFTLKRLDYRVGEGDWTDTSIVANEVQVQFKLVLQEIGRAHV